MSWNSLFGDWRSDGWRPTALILILISLVIFGLQAHHFMRIREFESQPHVLVKASGRIWLDKGGRSGRWLLLDTGQGQIHLSCETPTVLCMSSASVGGGKLAQGSRVSVAWIDGPAGMFSGTAHYPVRIEQLGQLLLEFTPTDIVEAQLHNLGGELALVGGAMFAVPLILLLVAGRRDRARTAAASAAWHRRHERDDDPVA